MEQDVGIWGPGSSGETDSLLECQGMCADSSECNFWLFWPSKTSCILKESNCDRRPLAGTWSGTKGCGPSGQSVTGETCRSVTHRLSDSLSEPSLCLTGGLPVAGYTESSLSLVQPASGWPSTGPGSPLTAATPALRAIGGSRGDHLALTWADPNLLGSRLQLGHTVVFDSVRNAISTCGLNEYITTTGVAWDDNQEEQVLGSRIL